MISTLANRLIRIHANNSEESYLSSLKEDGIDHYFIPGRRHGFFVDEARRELNDTIQSAHQNLQTARMHFTIRDIIGSVVKFAAEELSRPGSERIESSVEFEAHGRYYVDDIGPLYVPGGHFDISIHTRLPDYQNLVIVEAKVNRWQLNSRATIDQITRYLLDIRGVRAQFLVLACRETAIVYRVANHGRAIAPTGTRFDLTTINGLLQFADFIRRTVNQEYARLGLRLPRPYQRRDQVRPELLRRLQHERNMRMQRNRPL